MIQRLHSRILKYNNRVFSKVLKDVARLSDVRNEKKYWRIKKWAVLNNKRTIVILLGIMFKVKESISNIKG